MPRGPRHKNVARRVHSLMAMLKETPKILLLQLNRIVSNPLQFKAQAANIAPHMTNIVYDSRQEGCWKTKRASFSLRFGTCRFAIWTCAEISIYRVFQMCIQNSQRCSFVKEKFNHQQPVADVVDDKRNNAGSRWSNFRCLVWSARISSSEPKIQAPTEKRGSWFGWKIPSCSKIKILLWTVVLKRRNRRSFFQIILSIRWPDKSYVWQWN